MQGVKADTVNLTAAPVLLNHHLIARNLIGEITNFREHDSESCGLSLGIPAVINGIRARLHAPPLIAGRRSRLQKAGDERALNGR
jgi:hypothetical protein